MLRGVVKSRLERYEWPRKNRLADDNPFPGCTAPYLIGRSLNSGLAPHKNNNNAIYYST